MYINEEEGRGKEGVEIGEKNNCECKAVRKRENTVRKSKKGSRRE